MSDSWTYGAQYGLGDRYQHRDPPQGEQSPYAQHADARAFETSGQYGYQNWQGPPLQPNSPQQYPLQQYPRQQYPSQQYHSQQCPPQQCAPQQYPPQQYPPQQYPSPPYYSQQQYFHGPDHSQQVAPTNAQMQPTEQTLPPPSTDHENRGIVGKAAIGGALFSQALKFGKDWKQRRGSSSSGSSSDESQHVAAAGAPAPALPSQHHGHPHHPLGHLAQPGSDRIVFELRDKGDGSDHLVLRHDPNAGEAYSIHYRKHGFNGEIFQGPLLSANNPRMAAWKLKSTDRGGGPMKFYFSTDCPRNQADLCEWRFDPAMSGGSIASAFGTARGHHIRWAKVDESRDGRETRFTFRGTDIEDDERPDAFKVVMKTYYEGTFEIALWAVETRQQLDEMVMMTVAVMDWHRDLDR